MKNYFKLLLIVLLVITSFSFPSFKANAEDQTFDWVKQGLSLDENSWALNYSIAADSAGNIYSAGGFYGDVDLDKDNEGGEVTSSQEGGSNLFITKHNSLGLLQWVKKMGGDYCNINTSYISTDSAGNIYTVGGFTGTADFDIDNEGGELTSLFRISDIFIVKHNSAGEFQWVKQIKGDSNSNYYNIFNSSITVDSYGSVYITGTRITGVSNDIFITKYDSAGEFQWIKQIGSTGNDEGHYIVADPSGNIYSSGIFSGTVDFDIDNEGGELTSLGGSDIFIVKHNSAGEFQWVKQIKGLQQQSYTNSIDLDLSGNIYVIGNFSGTVDFDIDNEGGELISSGIYDIFVTKYNSEGAFQWVKQVKGTAQNPRSISVGLDNDIYIVGAFSEILEFNSGEVDAYNMIGNTNGYNVFISKFESSSGTSIFAKKIEINSDGSWVDAYSVKIDKNNNIYIGGEFGGVIDFNTEDGVSELTSGDGGDDAYLLKLGFPVSIVSPTISTSEVSSITQTTATLNGEITDNGGEDLTELGFQIGLDTSYTMASVTIESDYSSGTFSYNISDLDCNITYHYRAYGINSEGIGYGNDITFTTSDCSVEDNEDDNNIRRHSRVIGSINPSVILGKKSEEITTTNPQINNPLITSSFSITYTRLIKQCLRGDDIKQIQSYLLSKGYTLGIADGIFGQKTKQAIIAFQKANGLTADGLIGKLTIAKINELK